MNLSDFYKLVDSNPPAFHYWDNEPKVGGLDKPYFEWLESLGGLLGRSGEKVVVETGAGLSTLFFLSSSYSVHSFGMPYTIISLANIYCLIRILAANGSLILESQSLRCLFSLKSATINLLRFV